jgi:protein associated with RNAse G/E
LDRDELEFNQVDYQYPEKLVQIVETEMKDLLDRIEKSEIPFSSDIVLKDYGIYLNLKKQMNRKTKNKIPQNKK